METHAPIAIAVHGGAGGSRPEQEDGLHDALHAGIEVLIDGGTALDAVGAAVAVLEDDPNFNAGRGATRTADGLIELDAAIMDGSTKRAGAVTCITRAKNPVLVARLLLDREGAVFLAGPGADRFAGENGADIVRPQWFAVPTPASAHGTVGAVAVDSHHNLAAATSTGGVTGQSGGRVGDTPIIGAGTFADVRCAVSATGDGEAFIRAGFGHLIAHRIADGWSLGQACDDALGEVKRLGGSGGCVAVAANGAVYLPFTTAAMPRGWARSLDDMHVVL